MRIISWNCNGALSRKLPLLNSLSGDVLIIQEASARDVAAIDAPFTHWVGKGHRGLAVIGYRDLAFRIDPSWDDALPWFTPLHVGELHLLAVWASVLTHARRYVRLLHEALDLYSVFLTQPQAVIIGDFNSSTVFDTKHRGLSHTDLVTRLSNQGFTSVWHHQHAELHGEESRPTFHMYRHPEPTWHLDYAFVSTSLLPAASLTIGEPALWLTLSDHLPLVLDL